MIYISYCLLVSSYDRSVRQASRSIELSFFDPTVSSLLRDLFEGGTYFFLFSNSKDIRIFNTKFEFL